MNIEGSYSGLSMAELSELRAQRFQSADTDSSGGLTLEEMLQGRQNLPSGKNGPSIEDMFAQMDADGDGEVTQSEMEAAPPPPPPSGPPPGGGMASDSDDDDEDDTIATLLEALEEADDSDEEDSTASAGSTDDDEDETGTEQTVSLLAKMTQQAYANTASGASSYRTLTGAFF